MRQEGWSYNKRLDYYVTYNYNDPESCDVADSFGFEAKANFKDLNY